MTFMRLKTDSAGRVYLYEEDRWREGNAVKSKSRSHGRVHGFWFVMAMIVDNFGDIFRTKTHGYDPDEAERQALEVQERQRAEDAQRLRDVVNPTTYDAKPPAIEAPPAPHPEEPESAPPSDDSEAPEAPGDAPDPE
jgi:hypothetical protein